MGLEDRPFTYVRHLNNVAAMWLQGAQIRGGSAGASDHSQVVSGETPGRRGRVGPLHQPVDRMLLQSNSSLQMCTPHFLAVQTHHFESCPGMTVRSLSYRLPEHKRLDIQTKPAEMLKIEVHSA